MTKKFHQKAQIYAFIKINPQQNPEWKKQYSGNIKVKNGRITEPDYLSKTTSDWDLSSPPYPYDYDEQIWNEASKIFDLGRAWIYCDLAIEFESSKILKEFKRALGPKKEEKSLGSIEKSTETSSPSSVMNNIKSGTSFAFGKLKNGLKDVEVDTSKGLLEASVTVPVAGTNITGDAESLKKGLKVIKDVL